MDVASVQSGSTAPQPQSQPSDPPKKSGLHVHSAGTGGMHAPAGHVSIGIHPATGAMGSLQSGSRKPHAQSQVVPSLYAAAAHIHVIGTTQWALSVGLILELASLQLTGLH